MHLRFANLKAVCDIWCCLSVCVCQYGMSPVMWAAWSGHVDVVKLLLDASANTSIINRVSQSFFLSLSFTLLI